MSVRQTSIPSENRREVRRLAILFASLYFIQGIAEPGEGLIAQPLRSMMRSWEESVKNIATVSLIISLPWVLKPFYGLLTDFVPILGSRRRSYLVICSLLTVIGLLLLFFYPPRPGQFSSYVGLLLLASVGVAFSDIVVDALMVEKGQPLGLTGQLQSIQWTAIYTASILTGVLGGYLSEHHWQHYAFLICGLATVPTLFMAWFFVDESHSPKPPGRLRESLSLLRKTACSPIVLAVGAFLFLLNFNPFSFSVLYLRMTEDLGWSDQFVGTCTSVLSAGSVLGSVAYGLYCRRVPFHRLIHLGLAASVASTMAYWLLNSPEAALAISFFSGFTLITATLVQLDLAARICPPAAAATTFALLMAISNLGYSSSAWAGGLLSEMMKADFGPALIFNILVGIGVACTGVCWLFVPLFRKLAAAAEDSPAMALN